jgi:hypothetical protein
LPVVVACALPAAALAASDVLAFPRAASEDFAFAATVALADAMAEAALWTVAGVAFPSGFTSVAGVESPAAGAAAPAAVGALTASASLAGAAGPGCISNTTCRS